MGGPNANTTAVTGSNITPAAVVFNKQLLITDMLLSSVVPGHAKSINRGTEPETDHRNLTGLDLAMKLHYLHGVYFFDKEAVNGMTKLDLKPPMFDWLELYRVTCGRIRLPAEEDDDEPPVIKMNDGGVRIVEAKCDGMTIEEWLKLEDCCGMSDELLVNGDVLGPDLHYSPLVFIQITWFKCGGISLGLTWAHLLGDAFSASSFLNSLTQFMKSDNPPPPGPLQLPSQPTIKPAATHHHDEPPKSLKHVDPVKTHWTTPKHTTTSSSYTFHFTSQQINRLRSNIHLQLDDRLHQISSFELVSAVIWRSIAKIRKHREPNTITICKHNQTTNRDRLEPFNGSVIIVTETPHPPSESELSDLVTALRTGNVESDRVREFVERESGSSFVMYGANLTVVDMEDVDLYGLSLNGKEPVFVNYTIAGVASGGAVVVLPAPEKEGGSGGGRVVTVMLDEEEIRGLKWEIKSLLEEGV